MAKKKRSSSIKSGTIHGETHVDSRAYGEHVRAARGSIKPAKLNKTLKQNALDMPRVNAQAKVIFDALKPYRMDCYDGGWWSRLVAVFKRHYQAGHPPNYSLLEKSELNEQCKVDGLLSGLRAGVVMRKQEVDVQLEYSVHPSFRSEAGITKYSLSVIGVFIHLKDLTAVSEVADFEKLSLKNKVMPLKAMLAIRKKPDVVVVCVKVGGIYDDGGPTYSEKMNGMRIVKVSAL